MATASTDAGGLVSIPALLDRNATKFATKTAYREKEFGIWQSWTWGEVSEEIEALALGLMDLGLARGEGARWVRQGRAIGMRVAVAGCAPRKAARTTTTAHNSGKQR